MASFNLLVRRSTKARKESRYPWTLNIFIYVVLLGFTSGLAFLLERTFTIDAFLTQQPNGVPGHASVLGGLSSQDMIWVQTFQQAKTGEQESFIADLFNIKTHASSLQHPYKNHSVFIPELFPEQLLPGAQGSGSFTQSDMASVLGNAMNSPAVAVTDTPLGKLVRWPRWGIRVACRSLPDPALHLVPLSPSNYTYLYLPYSLIGSLAADLQLQVSIPPLITPWKPSATLLRNDTLPAGLDPSTIYTAYVTSDDGSPHVWVFFTLDNGTSGKGWTLVDVHMVRVKTAHTPNGSFLATASVNGTQIGYDVVICLEAVEPWIVEAYNITGRSPYTTRILEPGNTVGKLNGTPYPGVASMLDSSNISEAYLPPIFSARKDMTAESKGFNYYPSPVMVKFAGEGGALDGGAYTKLSPSSMEAVIGSWDASRALPYLVGTGYITAETREDRIIGTGAVNILYLGLVLGGTLLVGIIADVCIPRLPGGVPLRDFGVLSSITVARSALRRLDEVGRAPDSDRPGPNQPDSDAERPPSSANTPPSPGLGPEFYMDLDELRKKIGDVPTGAQIERSTSPLLDKP
ncbi:hypothetical protein BOTBODRAFT_35447, partial [Botryobasidium botryosum FD-172 SS1]